MHEELREKAEKKVKAKTTIYILATVFTFASSILVVLGQILPDVAIWFWLAIACMMLTLGFLYFFLILLPYNMLSKEWQEYEIEKELASMQRPRTSILPDADDLSEEDRLELKELDRLKRKWGQE